MKTTEESTKLTASAIAKSATAAGGNLWRSFWSEGPKHLLHSTVSVIGRIGDWLMDAKRAQYGLAVTRILLGTVGLTMLMANFPTRFYSFGNASRWTGDLTNPVSDFPKLFPFSISHAMAQTNLGLNVLYLLLAILATALILGWRTRIVLPMFLVLWVGFIEIQDMTGDQGDNIFRITLFGLLFADSGLRWSVDAKRRAKASSNGPVWRRLFNGAPVLPSSLTNLSHNLVLVALTCQVSFVYVSGALYKAGGVPWQRGSAIYDTMGVYQFSTWPELAGLMTAWAPLVAALSIGTIVVQVGFPGALLHRWTRIPFMFAIFGFHAGIAIFMGLPWFSLSMVAIDSIFIRDVTWLRLAGWVKRSIRGGTDLKAADTDVVERKTAVVDDSGELVSSGSVVS